MASVDDIEELIATRRLNGLEDNLYREETMTEEAFNELIDNFEVVAYLTEYGRRGIKENVKKLQARIKELEEENKIFVQNGNNVKLEIYIKNNYIPKQKVKDKIKDLEYNSDLGFEKSLEEIFKIEVLEELLRED